MTDAEVITAIKANHLRANVSWLEQAGGTLDWDRAVLDPGGTIFGPGPYAQVPTTMDDAWIRVYPPERLRKRLMQGLLDEWRGLKVP